MALFEESGTDPREYVTPRGTLRVWTVAPTIYVTRMVGMAEEGHAELLESYGLQRIEENCPRKIHAFHDWFDMTGYESKCRKRLTSWTRIHRDEFDELHMCIRSKIVAMGIQLANTALNDFIQVHSARAPLEAELRRAMRASSATPKT